MSVLPPGTLEVFGGWQVHIRRLKSHTGARLGDCRRKTNAYRANKGANVMVWRGVFLFKVGKCIDYSLDWIHPRSKWILGKVARLSTARGSYNG